ncbi:uncharacterized protein BT62DRAFT_1074995 [Guyanagaster necrorhizus]|uniref:Autophagy-related protein 29 n=1 Tax=Guyanagaster necrorhizus TaxID=856835 RepID=A0A9P7VVD8_9AGAR|nr:uncharacterized protein BT62DRAFT_1074995 [Guyanagaster necrorhizus MCA 3950]KAG7447624.1 hypothetical protein BT62DRAFT_1074995 [Guyanagaster necrorhizus MCA 3950]
MPADAPPVRVVVRLPYNKPEDPPSDPPRIEWTPEKADILWKVIERSRTTDNGGTDWKGLASHLQVPLPYLLYRVHARFQEELRGLHNIPGVLSPSAIHVPAKVVEDFPFTEPPSMAARAASRLASSSRLSGSPGRNSTPLGIRARLSSLGHNSPRPKKASSSSTLTLQSTVKPQVPARPPSLSSSESTDSEDEYVLKEEEADRQVEEQEALDRKLKDLQRMMTNDALGLVGTGKKNSHSIDRGRVGMVSPMSVSSLRRDTYSNRSASQSLSSASSPQGSIPDIPSPPSDFQPHSPISRHMSPSKSSSPPALSPRSAIGQRYGHLVRRTASDGSNGGSEASSFSDISDASLSTSALESALLSNIRGTGSRFSNFAMSRFGGRSNGVPH